MYYIIKKLKQYQTSFSIFLGLSGCGLFILNMAISMYYSGQADKYIYNNHKFWTYIDLSQQYQTSAIISLSLYAIMFAFNIIVTIADSYLENKRKKNNHANNSI